MKKVLIIGAGPAGLTAAYELLKRGEFDVTILEKTDRIGGISQTVRHGGNRMDIGGHRFFSKDQRVMQWWADMMPLQGAPSYDDKTLGRDVSLTEGGPDPASATKCDLCSEGSYCPAGATSETPCPAGSFCTAGVSAGTKCAIGSYSAEGASACTACAGGKTTSATGQTSCNATCANNNSYDNAWETATWSNNSVTNHCTIKNCAAGSAYASGVSYTNTKGTCTACAAGTYQSGTAHTYTSCNAIKEGCFGGEGSLNECPNSCPAAETGWTLTSTTGLTKVTDCTETTTPTTTNSPIATICTDGTLTKNATSATAWGSAKASGLTAKAGRYVDGTTCSACAPGTYTSSATTAISCTPASAGYYVSGEEATGQTACPAGTYQGSTGKTSCSDAVAGTYTTGCQDTTNNKACTGTNVCGADTYSDAKASSCKACTTAKGYGNSGTTDAEHAGVASCKVTCGAGQYVASAGAGCVNVGVDTTTNTGYWGAGGTVSQTATLARNKCDTGLITTGSGTGANEAADCGRKLHAGDNVIYLRSAERTSPSLRVKVGDTTFYGALSTALSGALKVSKDGTKYSVVNDWQ